MIVPFYGVSQEKISSNSILASARNSLAVQLDSQKVAFLEKEYFQLPVIDELEFRTETDRFDLSRQEYTLRARFHEAKERTAQNNLHQKKINRMAGSTRISIADALNDRYNTMVDYWEVLQELEWQEQYQVLVEDRYSVLRKQAAAMINVPILSLVKAEEAVLENQNRIDRLNQKVQQIEEELGVFLGETNTQLDTSNFISLERIAEIFQTINSIESNHPALQDRQMRIEEDEASYELEEAENENTIEYIQLRYANRKDLVPWQEFSVGIGIRLPFPNNNLAQLNDIRFEQLENTHRKTILEQTIQVQLLEHKKELQLLFAERKALGEQIRSSQAFYALEQYQKQADQDPLILLELQEILLKKEQQLLDLKIEIIEKYVDLLQISGKMVAIPYTNYLEETLPSF